AYQRRWRYRPVGQNGSDIGFAPDGVRGRNQHACLPQQRRRWIGSSRAQCDDAGAGALDYIRKLIGKRSN
ncbi:MAG: hypothetical protein ACRETX_01255, partial [Steroidobacteraceae bacterium]